MSKSIQLKKGDLIYTGTPAGVAPTVSGDEVILRIDGLTDLITGIGDSSA